MGLKLLHKHIEEKEKKRILENEWRSDGAQ